VRGPFPYEKNDLKWQGSGERCLFDGPHDSGGFFLIKRASGPIQAGCRHDSCKGKKWPDLRLKYEPDAYNRGTEPVLDSDLAVLGPASNNTLSISVDPADKERPRPLYREVPPGEEFPVDALGELGAAAARNIQEATRAPLAICAQSVLAAMNLAVTPHVDVELPTGEVKPTSEFFATIASSGERKSAADSRAIVAFRKFEDDRQEAYRDELFAWRNAVEAWEKQRAEVLRVKKTKEEKRDALQALGQKPEAPVSPMMLAGGDPTIEGLIRLFHEGGVPVAGMFTDEGGAFIGGHAMNEEVRLHTAASLSKFWDGDVIRRVRGGEGYYAVRGRRLCVHILVQPEAAQQMFADPVLRDQGLLTRFLAVMPARAAGTRSYAKVGDFSQISNFSQRVRELLAEPLPYADRDRFRDGLKPAVIKLSEEAGRLWENFYNHIEARIGPGGEFDEVAGLVNKAAEHATRLATTIARFNNSHTETLGSERMHSGVVLAGYFIDEALRISQAAAVNADLEMAQEVLDWLQHRWEAKPKDLVSLPDIYQHCPHHAVRSKEVAARIVEILVDHGWLEPVLATKVNGSYRREVYQIIKEGE
jgi:hypothetical protein